MAINHNERLKEAMGDDWKRACDLTEVYYDAGARLRKFYRDGICEKKHLGGYAYYRLKKREDLRLF